jgi:archaellum component FlaC
VSGLSNDVHGISKEMNGISKKYDGLSEKYDGLSEKYDGISSKYDGISNKYDGISNKYDGISNKYDGLSKKYDGLSEKYDGLSEKYDGISSKYDGISNKYDGISNKYDGISNKYDGLSNKYDGLSEKYDGLSEKYDGLSEKYDGLSKEMHENFHKLYLHTGEDDIKIARESSVEIRFFVEKIVNNTIYDVNTANASGTLVNFNGRTFVSTARHNFVNADCVRDTANIRLTKYPSTILKYKTTIIFKNADLALIEVDFTDENLPIIEKSKPELLTKIYSSCFRNGILVGGSGRIVELNSTEFLTDTGGSSGFSGCGYFANGKLIGVHIGSGNYLHTGSLEVNSFQKERSILMDAIGNFTLKVAKLVLECTKSFSDACLNPEKFKDDMKKMELSLYTNMQFHSRNPRTRVQAAYVFYSKKYYDINKSKKEICAN